jgi:hypothetical protein
MVNGMPLPEYRYCSTSLPSALTRATGLPRLSLA